MSINITSSSSKQKRYEGMSAKDIIEYKKRKKQEEAQRLKDEKKKKQEETVCTSCGNKGHRNEKSAQCPNNAKKAKAQEKQAKSKAKKERQASTPKSKPLQGCPTCRSKGRYDSIGNPHNSSRDGRCPYHEPTLKEKLRDELGDKHSRFMVKCGLETAVRVQAPANDDQDDNNVMKANFITEVQHLTDLVREVAIRSMLFASYFLYGRLDTGAELQAILFTEHFFRGCQQLVCGMSISHNALPKADMTASYNQLLTRIPTLPVPQHLLQHTTHASCLSEQSQKQCTIFINNIVENFGSRATKFLYCGLRRDETTNNIDDKDLWKLAGYAYNAFVMLDTKSVFPNGIQQSPELERTTRQVVESMHIPRGAPTPSAITRNPAPFFIFLHRTVQAIEQHNMRDMERASGPQVKVTPRWCYDAIEGMRSLQGLSRRQRSNVCVKMSAAINDSATFRHTNMAAERVQDIQNCIMETRQRIERSRAFLDPNQHDVNINDCFRPPIHLVVNQVAAFNIIPNYGYIRQHVGISMNVLKILLRHSGCASLICTEEDGEDQHTLATRQFSAIFDLGAVRTKSASIFTNRVVTDGVALGFVYAKAVKDSEGLPDLSMEDFDDYDLDQVFSLWGLDPGEKTIFMASDGFGEERHQLRSMTKKEYYEGLGLYRSRRLIQEYKQQRVQVERDHVAEQQQDPIDMDDNDHWQFQQYQSNDDDPFGLQQYNPTDVDDNGFWQMQQHQSNDDDPLGLHQQTPTDMDDNDGVNWQLQHQPFNDHDHWQTHQHHSNDDNPLILQQQNPIDADDNGVNWQLQHQPSNDHDHWQTEQHQSNDDDPLGLQQHNPTDVDDDGYWQLQQQHPNDHDHLQLQQQHPFDIVDEEDHWRLQHQDAQNHDTIDMSIQEIESNLPPRKVSSQAQYLLYLVHLLPILPLLLSHYDERYTILRWQRYQGRQRMEAELTNILINGGTKYGKMSSKARRRRKKKKEGPCRGRKKKKGKGKQVFQRDKWRPQPFQPSNKIPLIAFGSGTWKHRKGWSLPGLKGVLMSGLKKAESQGKVVVAMVNESYTSKTCHGCHNRELQNVMVPGGAYSLHSVLHCTNCHKIWNRDVMASKSIYEIADHVGRHRTRPSYYSK